MHITPLTFFLFCHRLVFDNLCIFVHIQTKSIFFLQGPIGIPGRPGPKVSYKLIPNVIELKRL